ncbi:serine/threonine-protein kinase [Micromonospora sp. CPCC 206061]|uniref:serine/threonine-protein kinase n=1 Tax=Micromonospora sp. CPCC 206061 TaxID=3122410 RepID=UPI002FF2366F
MTSLPLGTAILGRYVILGAIGHGGVSTVYEAIDVVMPRRLAIKALAAAHAADPWARDGVRREALIIDRLRHPSVPRVYGYGDAPLPDGTVLPYVVMELLAGVSLATRLAQGPLPWTEAVPVAAAVADVLAVAHRRGLVHRDLSAGNVMLTPDGIKIVDFGLATTVERKRTLPGKPRLTRTTVPRRQPILPAHRVTTTAQPADDVYALGVLLYQMVTGQSPYPNMAQWPAAPGADFATPHFRCVAPTPVLAVPGLPRDVAEICRACMAKRPTDRPSGRDVALALWALATPASPATPHQTLR